MARIIVYKFPALTDEEMTELLTLLAAAGALLGLGIRFVLDKMRASA